MADGNLMTMARVLAVLVLYLFLPLSALTYYFFRRQRRTTEVECALAILHIAPRYRNIYLKETVGYYFLWEVTYASGVSCLGLTLLFLANSIGLAELPSVPLGNIEVPRKGSRLILGMAFLGGYLWGLQYMAL